MGNLLGAPVTDKETHRGVTKDEQLKFGLSSMQGWRVHMEDAHIAEGNLYALDVMTVDDDDDDEEQTTTNLPTNKIQKSIKISLPGHALFAVYDGHGGTFAALYAGNNFLRILSKQPNFVRYAKMCSEDVDAAKTAAGGGGGTADGDTAPKQLPTAVTKAARAANKMQLLERALKQAFVETDYEIGLAVRGTSHADANAPYHDPAASPADGDNTSNTSSTKPAMEGAAMKAASDHLAAINDDGDSGTTTCVVLITPESIVCANAGDSRAVFARRPLLEATVSGATGAGASSNTNNDPPTGAAGARCSKAVPLSFDHKPDDEQEERRVRNAGGYVAGGRVEGDLAVSRGLGDFRFKQMAIVLNNTQLYPELTDTARSGAGGSTGMDTTDDEGDGDNNNGQQQNSATQIQHQPSKKSQPTTYPPGDQKVSPIPDVIVHARNPERDEYVVVACDGIWDVVSNHQCVAELDAIMYDEGERDLGLVSEEILDTCLRYGSKDNMTVIVVQLPGCEKSYADAAAVEGSASSSVGSPAAAPEGAATDEQQQQQQQQQQQEGVTGRRRKRDNGDTGADDNPVDNSPS